MKKAITIMLSLIMVFAMSVSAFAWSAQDDSGDPPGITQEGQSSVEDGVDDGSSVLNRIKDKLKTAINTKGGLLRGANRSMDGTAYAVIDENGNLTFFRSEESYELSETGPFTDIMGNTYTGVLAKNFEDGSWNVSQNNFTHKFTSRSGLKVKTVKIADGQAIAPNTTTRWFQNENEMTSCDLAGLDTSNTTDMSFMFSWDYNLQDLDVSGFDTSSVTNMSCMFDGCTVLTGIDVTNFNTSNVRNMDYMFAYCYNIDSLDLSSFRTPNLTSMAGMFDECMALESLDLSGFNTSNVTDMKNLFFCCRELSSVNVSGLDTSSVKNMEKMFSSCVSLSTLDLSSFHTANVEKMDEMFSGCSSLKKLNIENFSVEKTPSMANMFDSCSKLRRIKLGPNMRFYKTERPTESTM